MPRPSRVQNDIVAANQKMAQELKRVGQVVGKEDKTRERARFDQRRGAWGEMEGSVNTLIDDLLRSTIGLSLVKTWSKSTAAASCRQAPDWEAEASSR